MSDEAGGRESGKLPEEAVLRLVGRARDGDGAAFGELVRLYETRALSVAYRVLRNPEEARDAVQEACLRAYRYLGTFRTDRPFLNWFMRIVLHEALDSRRAREARPETGPVAEGASASVSGDQEASVLASERRRVLEELLDELTPRERAAFVLRDVEGWATADVAEALGCRQATVRRHLSLARQRLRGLLRRRYPDLLDRSNL